MDGAILLREVQLGGVLVRRGLIAAPGVFVVAARAQATWRLDDLTALEAQVGALAGALRIEHGEVSPIVVVEGSS